MVFAIMVNDLSHKNYWKLIFLSNVHNIIQGWKLGELSWERRGVAHGRTGTAQGASLLFPEQVARTQDCNRDGSPYGTIRSGGL
jgi:hypothetical protein